MKPVAEDLEFLDTKLLEHQRSGVSKVMYSLDGPFAGCILGDMMGLGKTLMTIVVSHLDRGRHGCFDLILTTKTCVSQWEEEFKWHVKEVRSSLPLFDDCTV